MTRPFRFLDAGDSPTTTSHANPDGSTDPAGSDFVLILAALLCALISVLGLASVARCTWLSRRSPPSQPDSEVTTGLEKEVLRSLPKLTLAPDSAARLSDCAICLAELAAGDEIRVLPQCCHAFHVECVDAWLRSHSSCPSCRQILSATSSSSRCEKCSGLPAAPSSEVQ